MTTTRNLIASISAFLGLVACGPRPVAHAPVYSPAPSALVPPTPGDAVEDAAMDEAPTEPASDVTEVPVPTPVYATENVGEPSVVYHLRRGETLDHFARWAELPVEVISEASQLPLDGSLAVGTAVRVPADHARRSRIELRRDAHHERRAEGYLASRGGSVGTEFYVVRTGDTAWEIAEQNGDLPVWLVETFNPSLDLEALRPGQAVMLPVTADMIDAVSLLDESAGERPSVAE